MQCLVLLLYLKFLTFRMKLNCCPRSIFLAAMSVLIRTPRSGSMALSRLLLAILPKLTRFKAGMHSYLTKYAYKNTETPQLWTELEAASGKPLAAVMSTWTGQMGFPVIQVKSRQEGGDRILTLS